MRNTITFPQSIAISNRHSMGLYVLLGLCIDIASSKADLTIGKKKFFKLDRSEPIYRIMFDMIGRDPYASMEEFIKITTFEGVEYFELTFDPIDKKNKTDLGEVDVFTLIDVWNSIDDDKWKKVSLSNLESVNIKNIKKAWDKVTTLYTKDNFNDSLSNYLNEIKGRNPQNDYSRHRFTLFEFIKQGNGMQKFLNF